LESLVHQKQWTLATRPHFVSSSIGRKKETDSGGRDKVKGWVKRLSDSGLLGVVKGIIDQDLGNIGSDNVAVLDRHEHENYLVDPLVIFSFLVEHEYPLPVEIEPPIPFGEQWRIRELANSDLQRIADAVLAVAALRLNPSPREEELETSVVEYASGKAIQLPRWLFTRGGRELIGSFKGEWSRISRSHLLSEYRKLRLVPRSLHALLAQCITS